MRPTTVARRLAKPVRTRAADLLATPRPDPIFILGNQKAGTTAVARLLAYATASSYSHDMFYRRRWTDVSDLHTGALSIDEVIARGRSEFAKKVIKDPDLTFHREELANSFPDAQFAFVVRDPARNIKSILERLGLPGQSGLDRSRLPDSPLWQSVFDPTPLGLADGDPVEVLAQRWARAARVHLDAPDDTILIRYEDFAEDKEGAIHALARQLELEWMLDLGAHADKQFQPKGTSRSAREFFTDECLESIERHTRPEAEALGYKH